MPFHHISKKNSPATVPLRPGLCSGTHVLLSCVRIQQSCQLCSHRGVTRHVLSHLHFCAVEIMLQEPGPSPLCNVDGWSMELLEERGASRRRESVGD